MASKKAPPTHREDLMARAKKHTKLAFIYADDGAFATAAKMLHETARLFEEEWSRIQELLHPKS